MSVDGETSRVMKGVQHGACDYLLKPIRMKELRNIWQHVVRKRMQEARDIENHEADQFDEAWMLNGIELQSGKKRKDFDYRFDEKETSDSKGGDPSSVKKPRVVWTVDLHQKFVKAVNQIGFDSKFVALSLPLNLDHYDILLDSNPTHILIEVENINIFFFWQRLVLRRFWT